ncbi:MAG: hypothetical protein ABIH18_02990 [Candidatus Omnitrophota bacterium]
MDVKRIDILFFLPVLLCLTLFGCSENNLFSTWRGREINIDGKYTDWNETTIYYDEKTKVVFNLVNDADYLYVCLISRNREIETEIMESGFTMWFDPDGGKKKVFGISFPIGLRRMGMSIEDEKNRDISRDWREQEDRGGLIDRDKERLTDNNFNKRLETLEGLQSKLEILIKNNKPLELSLEEAGKLGIEAKVGRENDYFVYELKVPLVKSTEHIYAIEIKEGIPIGLGLEAEGGRPRRRESMFGSANELKLWFTVALFSY